MCPLCKGSGWVTCYHGDDRMHQYSFICSCYCADKFRPGDGKRAARYWRNACEDASWILVDSLIERAAT